MFRLPSTPALTLFAILFLTGASPVAAQLPTARSSASFRAFVSSSDIAVRGVVSRASQTQPTIQSNTLRRDFDWQGRDTRGPSWRPTARRHAAPFGRFATRPVYFGRFAYGMPFVPVALPVAGYVRAGPFVFFAGGFLPGFYRGAWYGPSSFGLWPWQFAAVDARGAYLTGYRDGYRDAYGSRYINRYRRYVTDPWRPGLGRTGSRGFWDAEQDWQRLRPRWTSEGGRPAARREPAQPRPRTARPTVTPTQRPGTGQAQPRRDRPTRGETRKARPAVRAPQSPPQRADQPRRQARPYLRPAAPSATGQTRPRPSAAQRRPPSTASPGTNAPTTRPTGARARDDKAGTRGPRQGNAGARRRATPRPRANPR